MLKASLNNLQKNHENEYFFIFYVIYMFRNVTLIIGIYINLIESIVTKNLPPTATVMSCTVTFHFNPC
jgi:hypothetical protein